MDGLGRYEFSEVPPRMPDTESEMAASMDLYRRGQMVQEPMDEMLPVREGSSGEDLRGRSAIERSLELLGGSPDYPRSYSERSAPVDENIREPQLVEDKARARYNVEFKANKDMRWLRDEVLDTFPNRTEGTEVEHIGAFYEAKGLQTSPVLILRPDELPAVRQRFHQESFSNSNSLDDLGGNAEETCAVYVPEAEMVVAVRWPYLEDDGPLFTYILAHEMGHSTRTHTVVARPDLDYLNANAPSDVEGVRRMGGFPDEGFCDMHAAQFVRSELGMPNGVWGKESYKPVTMYGQTIELPSAYVWPINGRPTATMGAFAGFALELITERFPSFDATLIRSRTGPVGYEEMAVTLDRVERHLYERLVLRPFTFPSFQEGLQLVDSRLRRRFGARPGEFAGVEGEWPNPYVRRPNRG